jgi:hypothetical protein
VRKSFVVEMLTMGAEFGAIELLFDLMKRVVADLLGLA